MTPYKIIILLYLITIHFTGFSNNSPSENITSIKLLSFEESEYLIKKSSDSKNDEIKDDEWEDFSFFKLHQLNHGNYLYIKINIEDNKFKTPTILFKSFLNCFEVYLSNKCIYTYNKSFNNKGSENEYEFFKRHIINIDEQFTNSFLIIKIFYNNPSNIGFIDNIYLGEKTDIFNKLIKERTKDLKYFFKDFCLSIIFIFIALISFFVFFSLWKKKVYSFCIFGFFSICLGIKYLSNPNLISIFNFSPTVVCYIDNISFLLIPLFLFLLVENIFGVGHKKLIRRIWQFHLLAVIFSIYFIERNIIQEYILFIILCLIINNIFGLYVISRYKHSDYSRIKICFIGFFIFFNILLFNEALCLLNIISTNFDVFGWGTLILVFTLGYILIEQYIKTTYEIKEISFELEKNKNKILNLEKITLQSKLDALKNQINPHFLFNTFNTLVSIIEENSTLAVQFVQELSNVYRYVLKSKVEELVEIKEEFNFIHSYSYLLIKRFNNNLIIDILEKEIFYNFLIPPLTLQLLIENAIKHNIISSKKTLTITIFKKNDYLIIKNNLQRKEVEKSTQIGLTNIIKRYDFFTKKPVIIEEDENYFTVKVPLLDNK